MWPEIMDENKLTMSVHTYIVSNFARRFHVVAYGYLAVAYFNLAQ